MLDQTDYAINEYKVDVDREPMTARHNTVTCDCQMCQWADKQQARHDPKLVAKTLIAIIKEAILDTIDDREWVLYENADFDEASVNEDRLALCDQVIARLQGRYKG